MLPRVGKNVQQPPGRPGPAASYTCGANAAIGSGDLLRQASRTSPQRWFVSLSCSQVCGADPSSTAYVSSPSRGAVVDRGGEARVIRNWYRTWVWHASRTPRISTIAPRRSPFGNSLFRRSRPSAQQQTLGGALYRRSAAALQQRPSLQHGGNHQGHP